VVSVGGFGKTEVVEVYVPNSVKTIVDFAFLGCGSLQSIFISDSVINVGNMAFSGCASLENAIYKEVTYSVKNTNSIGGDVYDLPQEFYDTVNNG
jgi:hypothetical protein